METKQETPVPSPVGEGVVSATRDFAESEAAHRVGEFIQNHGWKISPGELRVDLPRGIVVEDVANCMKNAGIEIPTRKWAIEDIREDRGYFDEKLFEWLIDEVRFDQLVDSLMDAFQKLTGWVGAIGTGYAHYP